MKNTNFDDLTEEQKENVVEFGMVTAHCSEEVLNAIMSRFL